MSFHSLSKQINKCKLFMNYTYNTINALFKEEKKRRIIFLRRTSNQNSFVFLNHMFAVCFLELQEKIMFIFIFSVNVSYIANCSRIYFVDSQIFV